MIQTRVRPLSSGRLAPLMQRSHPVLRTAGKHFRSPAIRMAVQLGMVVLCLIPIARQAAKDWEAIGLLASQLEVTGLIVATLALVLASFFLPTAMATFARGATRRIGYRDSALAYYSSQPMKYLPGSFWILPGRVVLLRGLGHDISLSSAALLFEMTTQVLSCAIVSAVMLALAGFTSAWYQEAVWLVLVGSLAVSLLLLVSPTLALRVLSKRSSARQAVAQLAAIPLVTRLRNLARATLIYAVMWGLMGISFYALLVATDMHLDLTLVAVAIGVSSLSWLAGFLTPISPGGVGVRESAIVLLLGPFVAEPQAVMVALVARVIALAVELGFFAGASLLLRSTHAATASPGRREGSGHSADHNRDHA